MLGSGECVEPVLILWATAYVGTGVCVGLGPVLEGLTGPSQVIRLSGPDHPALVSVPARVQWVYRDGSDSVGGRLGQDG